MFISAVIIYRYKLTNKNKVCELIRDIKNNIVI